MKLMSTIRFFSIDTLQTWREQCDKKYIFFRPNHKNDNNQMFESEIIGKGKVNARLTGKSLLNLTKPKTWCDCVQNKDSTLKHHKIYERSDHTAGRSNGCLTFELIIPQG